MDDEIRSLAADQRSQVHALGDDEGAEEDEGAEAARLAGGGALGRRVAGGGVGGGDAAERVGEQDDVAAPGEERRRGFPDHARVVGRAPRRRVGPQRRVARRQHLEAARAQPLRQRRVKLRPAVRAVHEADGGKLGGRHGFLSSLGRARLVDGARVSWCGFRSGVARNVS